MQHNDKEVTSLIASMKRALKKQHKIDVPHSALRASYLQALGENPHAFAGKQDESKKAVVKVAVQDPTFRTLYLAGDDIGCMTRLALDADGMAMLPEDFVFNNAKLQSQYAEIPRVGHYGLPDYLSDVANFYDVMGLPLAEKYEQHYKDLGDDSGDTCRLTVSMSDKEWNRVLEEMLFESPGFQEDVAEWVGLHYGVNFDREDQAKRLEWTRRYLDAQEEAESIAEANAEADAAQKKPDELEAAAALVEVMFEWVFPDEDSDSVDAYLNLKTGEIEFAQLIPDEVSNASVRVRIWVPNEGDSVEDARDGVDYTVYYERDKSGKETYFIHDKAITAIAEEYGIVL